MICLIALIIFSILGIFSLSYRRLAKEAFDCVFQRITFRPCRADFKQRVKAKIIAVLLRKNATLARIASHYFEILSWIFVIIFFASMALSARSIYNLVRYKNCNPQDPGSCIFTPQEKEQCQCQDGKVVCPDPNHTSCQDGQCDQCENCQK